MPELRILLRYVALLHHQPDGSAWPEPGFLSREIIRAAHDVAFDPTGVYVYAAGYIKTTASISSTAMPAWSCVSATASPRRSPISRSATTPCPAP